MIDDLQFYIDYQRYKHEALAKRRQKYHEAKRLRKLYILDDKITK